MDAFATEQRVEQVVGTAIRPAAGSSFPALVPVTAPGPGRLVATLRALPHRLAHRGGSSVARGPARRSSRGDEIAMSSLVRADAVSDHDLLSGFAIGDDNAGAAFVRRFQGRVYGMAVNLLGDRGLAEEVALEAFGRASRRTATYDPERGSVAAWLLRITRSLAIDALRCRSQALDREMAAAVPPANPITVEDSTVTSDLTAHTRAAVIRLPPDQSKALWLAVFCGYTAQQIAVSEDVALGTARTQIRQGLRTLRADLTPPDPV
jgi:RNA polymerase sigma factor (sigma-70 family)